MVPNRKLEAIANDIMKEWQRQELTYQEVDKILMFLQARTSDAKTRAMSKLKELRFNPAFF